MAWAGRRRAVVSRSRGQDDALPRVSPALHDRLLREAGNVPGRGIAEADVGYREKTVPCGTADPLNPAPLPPEFTTTRRPVGSIAAQCGISSSPNVTVETSRGCPGSCSVWCRSVPASPVGSEATMVPRRVRPRHACSNRSVVSRRRARGSTSAPPRSPSAGGCSGRSAGSPPIAASLWCARKPQPAWRPPRTHAADRPPARGGTG